MQDAKHGCGSKLNHQGTTAFSPWFHLQVFHFGYPCLTHSHMYFLYCALALWLMAKLRNLGAQGAAQSHKLHSKDFRNCASRLLASWQEWPQTLHFEGAGRGENAHISLSPPLAGEAARPKEDELHPRQLLNIQGFKTASKRPINDRQGVSLALSGDPEWRPAGWSLASGNHIGSQPHHTQKKASKMLQKQLLQTPADLGYGTFNVPSLTPL